MSSPDYLAYTVPCPLNSGKLAQVASFVKHWRALAARESAWQWRRFFETRGTKGLESVARAGWSRPWVASGDSTVTLAQQVMAQVAGQLQGYLGNVENTFMRLVAGSTLLPADKRRLFFLNRCNLWLAPGAVKDAAKPGYSLSPELRGLGRALFRQALRLHRRPTFQRYHPQLDQRSVKLGFARKANAFPLWAQVALVPGKTTALPVAAWPGLMATIAATSHALAPQAQARDQARQERAAAKRQEAGKPAAKTHRPCREAALSSLPQTLRLIVRPETCFPLNSPHSLSLGLVVDHQATRAQGRQAYRPRPGKVAAFDLGLTTLMVTDDGDLLGRNWMARLEAWDRQLLGIAQGQQKRGLPVATPRYRALVQRIDGFLKTEVFRLVNAWVARVRPEKIVCEATSFHARPGLSRRLNRLLSRFGKRYLGLALKRLEATHGIVVEERESAYSSQQCNRCGYVDAKNRETQATFGCRFCGHRTHADVNAARVVRCRRSTAVLPSTPASRRRLLQAEVARFQSRFPLPRAVHSMGRFPVRGRRDDPRWSNPYFREAVQAFRAAEPPTPPSVFARA